MIIVFIICIKNTFSNKIIIEYLSDSKYSELINIVIMNVIVEFSAFFERTLRISTCIEMITDKRNKFEFVVMVVF